MKKKIDIVALLILVASAMNCGLIGLFDMDAMSWVFGGQTVIASRIVYVMVAIAGLWCINLIVLQAKVESQPTLTPDLSVLDEEAEHNV